MQPAKFAQLREQHPKLILESVSHELTSAGLVIQPHLHLEPNLDFTSTFTFQNVTATQVATLAPAELEWLAFQLGLIETLSYWKATCSPVIEIQAGKLTAEQLIWWQKLLLNGLGEFFYRNQIDMTDPELVIWQQTAESPFMAPQSKTPPSQPANSHRVMVPIGGGKDSAVSQDLLADLDVTYLVVNPTPAALATAQLRPTQTTIRVDRQLDPQLLALNSQGYWNGHTPFSALVAFVSILAGKLWNLDLVAVSNERSSNEGNVQYLGQDINHQYSKTYEFEHSFRQYIAEALPGAPYYFSLLRPLFELQIARHFSEVVLKHPELGHSFRSCNVGQATNSWCGNCSKCLFAFLILSPFVPSTELTAWFGQDILQRLDLEPIALELFGKKTSKPFECVGTFEESLVAAYLTHQKYLAASQPVPQLLAKLADEVLEQEQNLATRAEQLLRGWNSQHGVPPYLEPLVKAVTTT